MAGGGRPKIPEVPIEEADIVAIDMMLSLLGDDPPEDDDGEMDDVPAGPAWEVSPDIPRTLLVVWSEAVNNFTKLAAYVKEWDETRDLDRETSKPRKLAEEMVRHFSHAVKGSCSFVAAWRIAMAARDLEAAVKQRVLDIKAKKDISREERLALVNRVLLDDPKELVRFWEELQDLTDYLEHDFEGDLLYTVGAESVDALGEPPADFSAADRAKWNRLVPEFKEEMAEMKRTVSTAALLEQVKWHECPTSRSALAIEAARQREAELGQVAASGAGAQA